MNLTSPLTEIGQVISFSCQHSAFCFHIWLSNCVKFPTAVLQVPNTEIYLQFGFKISSIVYETGRVKGPKPFFINNDRVKSKKKDIKKKKKKRNSDLLLQGNVIRKACSHCFEHHVLRALLPSTSSNTIHQLQSQMLQQLKQQSQFLYRFELKCQTFDEKTNPVWRTDGKN